MKYVIIFALISTFSMSNTIQDATVQSKELSLCKTYIKKAHDYQDTMKHDAQAEATLESYKEKVVKFCSVAL